MHLLIPRRPFVVRVVVLALAAGALVLLLMGFHQLATGGTILALVVHAGGGDP